MAENNGWNEWSRHVLAELTRLNDNYEVVSRDVNEVKAKLANYNPEELAALKFEVASLKDKDKDQEARLRQIETDANKFAGKWGIISLVGAAVLSLAISFLWSSLTKPAKAEKQSNLIPHEYRMELDELEDFRKLPS